MRRILTQFCLTLIGKLGKTHPEIFLKFSFSGSSHRPFYWKTHPIFFCEISILGRHTGRFSGKIIQAKRYVSYMVSVKKIEWMSFPVKRPVWRPRIEISEKNWMSFPVKRPVWRPRKRKFQKNFWMSFPGFANKG